MSMTREQIEAMGAGAEMDAAVKRAVGWKPVFIPTTLDGTPVLSADLMCPAYSTDLSHAFDAAHQMTAAHPWGVQLLTSSINPGTEGATYTAELNGTEGEHLDAMGPTLAVALCRLVVLATLGEAP